PQPPRAACLLSYSLLFHGSVRQPDLHPFPTRRASDLVQRRSHRGPHKPVDRVRLPERGGCVSKRIVVIPDTQIPLEDRKATAAVLGFIGEYQPDEVIHIGDLMDYPKPSRWSKGTAAEFQGSVFAESDYAKRHFLEPLRNVYEGP